MGRLGGSCLLGVAGFCLPTGGCILLSITVYFWSLLAEKDKVVPTFTFNATDLGTLSRTALPPPAGLTSMETWSDVCCTGRGGCCGELYGLTPPGVGFMARNTCLVPILGT